MTNLDRLKECINAEFATNVTTLQDVSDWLMDFALNEFNIVISDAEAMDYLKKEEYAEEDE